MRDVVDELVRDYDMLALQRLRGSWGALDDRGRFACVKGFLVQRDHRDAEAILETHAADLARASFTAFVRLNVDRETRGEFADSLAGALDQDLRRFDDPFVKSEYEFAIGLSLIQCESYDLAQVYCRRSIDSLGGDPSLAAYAWRSHFNIALCQLKSGRYEAFRATLPELEASFPSLTRPAQAYLARLFVWLYLYLHEDDRAFAFIVGHLPAPDGRGPLDYRSSYLLKYLLFIAVRRGDEATFRRYHSRFLGEMLPKDASVAEALHDCLVRVPSTFAEVAERIDHFRGVHNLLDLTLLCEVLLRRILESREYRLLARAYEHVERHCLPLKVILPATDLRELGLLAYRATGRSRRFARLDSLYQARTPPWRLVALEKALAALEADAAGPRLVLDMGKRELVTPGRTIALGRRPTMLRFLREVFLGRAGVGVLDLGKRLYGPGRPESHRSRIASLLFVARRDLGIDFLVVESERISLADGRSSLVRRDQESGGRARQQEILRFARGRRRPWTITDLTHALPFPRRTAQADLAALVRRGQLFRTGKRRAATYTGPLG